MQTNGARGDTAETDPATPIWISHRTRQAVIVAGVAVLALLVYRVPTLVSLFAGAVALAVAISFPLRVFERVLPRGAAIALTLVLAVALLVLAITVIAPIIADQLRALLAAVPGIERQLDDRVPWVLDRLAARGLLPDSPERVLAETQERLDFAERMLSKGRDERGPGS